MVTRQVVGALGIVQMNIFLLIAGQETPVIFAVPLLSAARKRGNVV